MYSICKNRAFTLLELVITIAIIAVISMVAIPSFKSFKERQEISKLFPMIRQNVNLARNTAQNYRTQIIICSSKDMKQCEENQWNKGIIVFADLNSNHKIDDNETVYQSIQTEFKYGNLKWNGGATSPNVITFQGDSGLPLGSQGNFSYCSLNNAQNNRRMPLSYMGHLRVENTANC